MRLCPIYNLTRYHWFTVDYCFLFCPRSYGVLVGLVDDVRRLVFHDCSRYCRYPDTRYEPTQLVVPFPFRLLSISIFGLQKKCTTGITSRDVSCLSPVSRKSSTSHFAHFLSPLRDPSFLQTPEHHHQSGTNQFETKEPEKPLR